jgi:integrase/recombinase XerD
VAATRESAVVAAPRSLASLVEEFTATWGIAWGRVTRRKHADDFARFLGWLDATGRPATIEALTFPTLAAYVTHLRERPRIAGVWRGGADAVERVIARGSHGTLSPNTINAYMRPLRSLTGWLVDEGLLAADPFRRARRAAVRGALLPVEETPAKAATLEDLRTLERGCQGVSPLDLRDRAIVSILITSAARNSSVRLLRVEDVDFERSIIRFRRAKGGKTLEVSLHADARASLLAYLPIARPALLGGATDTGYLFPALHGAGAPLGMNALSLMLTRRYRAGGGSLPYFGSHRIRHGTATLMSNNGMPIDELSRYLGHSSTDVTRRYARQTPETLGARAAEALARAGVTGQ